MAFITYPLNNIDYTAEDAELFHCTRSSGIWAEDSFSISVTGADNNVTIGTGIAWINNEEFSGKVAALKSAEVLDLGIADSIYPRIDVIAIQYSANNNATDVVIKKGTPATNPVRPAIVRSGAVYELYLASIYRPAGATVITASNITDLRMNKTLCGLMADSVTKVDMDAIRAQLTGLVEELEEAIQNIEVGEIVPIEKGGTNAQTSAGARRNINFIGTNPLASLEEDTVEKWLELGTGVAYISNASNGFLTNKPNSAGYLLNMANNGSFVNQLFFSQAEHLRTYKRAGSLSSGWYGNSNWLDVDNIKPSAIRLYRTTDYTDIPTTSCAFPPLYGMSSLAVDAQAGNLTFVNKTIAEYGDRTNQGVSGVLVGEGITHIQVNASVYIENASNAGTLYSLFLCRERNGTISRTAATRQGIAAANKSTIVLSTMMPVEEGDFIYLMGWKGYADRATNVLCSYTGTQMTVSAVN